MHRNVQRSYLIAKNVYSYKDCIVEKLVISCSLKITTRKVTDAQRIVYICIHLFNGITKKHTKKKISLADYVGF